MLGVLQVYARGPVDWKRAFKVHDFANTSKIGTIKGDGIPLLSTTNPLF